MFGSSPFLVLLLPSHSEAPLFYFCSFRATQKHHFSIFAPSEPLRSTTFLFLLLPSHSEAPLFYFCSFRATQKHHFSIFAPSEPLRSTTFLFLLLPSHSEAPLFYFYSFRATQKLVFQPIISIVQSPWLQFPRHADSWLRSFHPYPPKSYAVCC